MRELDYVLGRSGETWVIIPRSANAKARTPDDLHFDNRNTALEFVRNAKSEDFRFSGEERIDPEYRLAKYVYFVRPLGGSRFVSSGQDWGPQDPILEPGDIHPVHPKEGTEAVVLSAVQGEAAVRNGGDVMVLLEERPASTKVAWKTYPSDGSPPYESSGPPGGDKAYLKAQQHFAEQQKNEEDRQARFGKTREQLTLEHQGYRIVVVRGTLHYSRKWVFFTDFLADYAMHVFGKEWFEAEIAKPEAVRHPVIHGSSCPRISPLEIEK